MKLANLPKTKSYYYMNNETVLRICKVFGVDPKSIPKLGDKPWSVKYPTYVKDITLHDPCPICNGPQKREVHRGRGVFGVFYPGGIFCISHPNHTVAYNMAMGTVRHAVRNGKIVVPDGKEFDEVPELVALAEEAVKRALGKVCKHDEFLGDCLECRERLDSERNPIDKAIIDAIVEGAHEDEAVPSL